jgi:hypothetical protein
LTSTASPRRAAPARERRLAGPPSIRSTVATDYDATAMSYRVVLVFGSTPGY